MSGRKLSEHHYDILDVLVKLESLGEEWSSTYDVERMIRGDDNIFGVKGVGQRLGTLKRGGYVDSKVVNNRDYYHKINSRGKRLLELERPRDEQKDNPVQTEMDLIDTPSIDVIDHIPASVVITVENASGFILSSRSFDVGLDNQSSANDKDLKALRDELDLIKRKIPASVLEAFLEARGDR